MVCSAMFFCFKQKTAYEMRISDWSSDVCSSDLAAADLAEADLAAWRHHLLQPDLRLRSLRHARPQRLGQDHRPVALARRRYRRRDGARRDARALLPDLCRYRLLAQGLPAELRPRRIHPGSRSEEHTSELQSLMRTSSPVFCL